MLCTDQRTHSPVSGGRYIGPEAVRPRGTTASLQPALQPQFHLLHRGDSLRLERTVQFDLREKGDTDYSQDARLGLPVRAISLDTTHFLRNTVHLHNIMFVIGVTFQVS